MHQQYIVKGGGSLPDPATFCPSNGYIDPTQPNDDWLIFPKANSIYGLLYNWWAASDSRGFVAGWHRPTREEFITLGTYLSTNNGGKLKETGYTYWTSPNTGATNETNFNGRGAGGRYGSNGEFANEKQRLFMHNDYSDGGNSGGLTYNSGSFLYSAGMTGGERTGMSVRLIKNDGIDDGYVIIDGVSYNTCKIGTQVWLAENLKATHYANGDAIPEVTSDASWAALTTGALCAYNNDWNNV
jgi:uncharacterized protein (TIGR02145 family)